MKVFYLVINTELLTRYLKIFELITEENLVRKKLYQKEKLKFKKIYTVNRESELEKMLWVKILKVFLLFSLSLKCLNGRRPIKYCRNLTVSQRTKCKCQLDFYLLDQDWFVTARFLTAVTTKHRLVLTF